MDTFRAWPRKRQLPTQGQDEQDVEKHTRQDPSAGSSGGAGSSNASPPILLSPSPSAVDYDSGPERHNIGTDDEDDHGSDDMTDPYGYVFFNYSEST